MSPIASEPWGNVPSQEICHGEKHTSSQRGSWVSAVQHQRSCGVTQLTLKPANEFLLLCTWTATHTSHQRWRTCRRSIQISVITSAYFQIVFAGVLQTNTRPLWRQQDHPELGGMRYCTIHSFCFWWITVYMDTKQACGESLMEKRGKKCGLLYFLLLFIQRRTGPVTPLITRWSTEEKQSTTKEEVWFMLKKKPSNGGAAVGVSPTPSVQWTLWTSLSGGSRWVKWFNLAQVCWW